LYLAAGEFAKSIEAAGNIPTQKRTAELLPTLAAASGFGCALNLVIIKQLIYGRNGR
jgi:hypothetical protein